MVNPAFAFQILDKPENSEVFSKAKQKVSLYWFTCLSSVTELNENGVICLNRTQFN